MVIFLRKNKFAIFLILISIFAFMNVVFAYESNYMPNDGPETVLGFLILIGIGVICCAMGND